MLGEEHFFYIYLQNGGRACLRIIWLGQFRISRVHLLCGKILASGEDAFAAADMDLKHLLREHRQLSKATYSILMDQPETDALDPLVNLREANLKPRIHLY